MPASVLQNIIVEDEGGSSDVDALTAASLAEIQAIKNTPGAQYVSNNGPIKPDLPRALVELFKRPHIGIFEPKSLMKLLRNVYKKLKACGNGNRIMVPDGGRITVVGDIHGQIDDLLLILEEAGEPSPTNLILFNGDFVDRGAHGFEVVTIMFSYFAAYPGCVFMNRGNHEDPFVCCNYGFQEEVIAKYDQMTFLLYAEIFRFLPIYSLINESIFVVHGGLFHDTEVTLADLEEIDRTEYEASPEARREYLKQLQRDALWSDPRPHLGICPNSRGAGVTFGPDVAHRFMEHNDISMIIRSHECCRHGTEFPYDSKHDLDNYYDEEEAEDPLLVTLFSASNYLDGDNEGSYLTINFREAAKENPSRVPKYANKIKDTGMYFTCHRYRTSTSRPVSGKMQSGLEKTTDLTAMDLLLRKKRSLTMAFRKKDTENTEIVSKTEWANIMQEVTGLKILWLALIQSLVKNRDNDRAIYKHHMPKNHGHGTSSSHSQSSSDKNTPPSTSSQIMDSLYGNKKRLLEKCYYYFDTNGDGLISSDEFHFGCDALNKLGREKAAQETAKAIAAGTDAPAADLTVVPYELKEVDEMLNLMDFDHSGEIDINEFFEAFRLASRNTMSSA
eukprot:GSChrysophyteH2.ASY1.ANO1.780.1 assembled CDS